ATRAIAGGTSFVEPLERPSLALADQGPTSKEDESMNVSRKAMLGLAVVVAGSVLLAACGSSSTTNSSSGSGGSGSATVLARKVPTVGTVLVDAKGLTLYFLKGETAGNIMCTGSCATASPPHTVAAGAQPTAGSGGTGQA